MNYQFVPEIFRPMYNFGNNSNFSYFKYGNPLLSQINRSSPIDIKIPHGFEKKQQNIISDLNCSSTPFSPQNTPEFFEFDDTEIFLLEKTVLEETNLKETVLEENKLNKFIRKKHHSKKNKK